MVTGCTGGIGREYALGLAKKRMNLVLIISSRQKLEMLEKDILKQSTLHPLEALGWEFSLLNM